MHNTFTFGTLSICTLCGIATFTSVPLSTVAYLFRISVPVSLENPERVLSKEVVQVKTVHCEVRDIFFSWKEVLQLNFLNIAFLRAASTTNKFQTDISNLKQIKPKLSLQLDTTKAEWENMFFSNLG